MLILLFICSVKSVGVMETRDCLALLSTYIIIYYTGCKSRGHKNIQSGIYVVPVRTGDAES